MTGGPKASRHPSILCSRLADLDGRELELRQLQVTRGLVAGEVEGVLAALRGRGDVDAEARRARTLDMHVGLGPVDLVAVHLEATDAAGGDATTVDGAVGDQQVLAREAGGAVHVNRGALGERAR